MSKLEIIKHIFRNKGFSENECETIEEMKSYLKKYNLTDDEIIDVFTDDECIKAYLEEIAIIAMNEDRFLDAAIITDALYEAFKNDY